MAYAIHASGYKVTAKPKLEGNHLTDFLLYTNIHEQGKSIEISMGVTEYEKKGRAGVPRPARAFVQAVLEDVIGETLEYHVDVVSNMVKWRMGDRNGCVSDVFEVVKTVDGDTLEEEQWHVFDFQNGSIGTLLRPGISI